MAFKLKNIKLTHLHANTGQIPNVPANPRYIRDARFHALKKSIADAPEMLELREIIAYDLADDELVIIGGNMRVAAMKELGYKEAPVKILNRDTPADKLREYIIKDNEGFGQNDWDILANEWNQEELTDWGMEIPTDWNTEDNDSEGGGLDGEDNDGEEDEEDGDIEFEGVHDLLFESDNEFDIPTLKIEQQAGKIELPITPWGRNSRLRKDVITYHFYCDDYKFEALWKDPTNLLTSGAHAIIEPNFSLHNETPVAFGLQAIYKKRWIARYCQECGIKVYADLNVAPKFSKYNTFGIPKGYNAFCTRAIGGQMILVENDYRIAQEISGLEHPNFIVYGGGTEAKAWCKQHNVLYIEDYQQKELVEQLREKCNNNNK